MLTLFVPRSVAAVMAVFNCFYTTSLIVISTAWPLSPPFPHGTLVNLPSPHRTISLKSTQSQSILNRTLYRCPWPVSSTWWLGMFGVPERRAERSEAEASVVRFRSCRILSPRGCWPLGQSVNLKLQGIQALNTRVRPYSPGASVCNRVDCP